MFTTITLEMGIKLVQHLADINICTEILDS